MAISFSLAQTPATGSALVYNLKTLQKAQGFTVPKSSDATTYNSSGDQISSGSSGAGGLANTNAWGVVRCPLGRSWCFQRGSSNVLWRWKFSPLAGFGGGSPSATQVPSATDEVVLWGGGTDASPTFTTLFGTDNTLKQNICVGGASEGYSWYTLQNNSGLTTVDSLLMSDVMSSYDPGDTEPSVQYWNGASATTTLGSDALSSAGHAKAFLSNTLTSGNFNVVTLASEHWTASPDVGQTVAGNDVPLPIWWGRATSRSAPVGFKGISTLLRAASFARSNYVALTNSISGTNDWLYINGVALKWNGGTGAIVT